MLGRYRLEVRELGALRFRGRFWTRHARDVAAERCRAAAAVWGVPSTATIETWEGKHGCM